MPSDPAAGEAQAPLNLTPLDSLFRLSARGTTPRVEIIAGITTFLAASYLLVVIPSILSNAGIDRAGATTATILLFVGATTLMAFYANLPFIVGPGIGGSVIVAINLAGTEHVPWPVGLGVAFWSGILFFILTADRHAQSGHPHGAGANQAVAQRIDWRFHRGAGISQRRSRACECQDKRNDAG